MFPTFTGNSRRTRNVNLSGQKSDPFAGTPWGSIPSGGPSKSVTEAQAERQRRQQERDRLKAAQRIQRLWRSYRVRRLLQAERRQSLDALYTDQGLVGEPEARVARAFPLLLAIFGRLPETEDFPRLALFSRDLLQAEHAITGAKDHQLRRLVGILLSVVGGGRESSIRSILFKCLARIVELRPLSILDHLNTFYRVCATLCRQKASPGSVDESLLVQAIAAPFKDTANVQTSELAARAYHAFALVFLPESHLVPLEQDSARLGSRIDQESLASAVLDVSSTDAIASMPVENRLWLLAHLIGLRRASSQASHTLSYVKALYMLLSSLITEINTRYTVSTLKSDSDTDSGANVNALPRYITKQLSVLVDRKEISDLLEKFAINYTGTSSSEAVQYSSTLAGYILVLLRCFPSRSDDIRMRLYLADFPGQTGGLPAVKLFWAAVLETQVFHRIVSNENSALNFLLQRHFFQPSSSTISHNSAWDTEWRTVLLFLELYVFILRLTDDEDFFNGAYGLDTTTAASRVRASTLSLEDLKQLSLFLKNLGFTLYYNAAELVRAGSAAAAETPSMSDVVSPQIPEPRSSSRPGYFVTSGISLDTFRSIVNTALRMLYERDSRRPFLPTGHWLMTSRFDMEAFRKAVVMEELRQSQEDDEEASSSDEEEGADGEGEDGGDTAMAEAGNVRPRQSLASQRRSRHAAMEDYRAKHNKELARRRKAFVTPKLDILRNMPFTIPFDSRIRIFREFVYMDKHERRQGHITPDAWRHYVMSWMGSQNPLDGRGFIDRYHAQIKRGDVLESAFEAFWPLGEGLKEPIQITFVDQFGSPEAGIDGGGVAKEFLISVTTEAFSDSILFSSTKNNTLYPNPSSLDQLQASMRSIGLSEKDWEWHERIRGLLERYEFLGRIVGKCMYEGILIDTVFAGFFLLKWSAAATDQGYRANINDLRELDEELYQGLLRLKSMEDVSQLELDFTVTDQISMPGEKTATVTRELIPNGKNIAVTNENRPLYISYMARHRLVVQSFHQTQAFLRGLGTIVSPSWLCMFNQTELQWLVGGEQSEIDVEDLRSNTTYSGLYEIGDDGEEHATIKLFWQAMHEFADSERRAVLKFVTSTPRAPLLGFSQLSPKFTIRDAGSDLTRLPSASTCVNLLKLPLYRSLEQLKTKLLYAVSSNAGFDLS